MGRSKPVELLDRRDFPILYVDDEPENLRAFELTFRREFTILTAESADAGMAVLNANPVAVVLSDHKMPGITGVEFLSKVREFDSRATRMLVTAYGDAETLGHAINDGCIYRYIPKPWEPDDMRLALRQAIDIYALDRERDTLLDELHLLARLTRSLYRELDQDRVFETLLDAVHGTLGYDGASLLLFDGSGDVLRWCGIRPEDTSVAQRLRQIRIDRGSAPEFIDQIEIGAVQTLTPERMSQVESPIRTWITEVSAQEMIVVPLAGSKGTIGALAVDNRRGGQRFGANDRTLLGGLSTQASVAIENARMVEAMRGSRSELRRAERMSLFGTLARDVAAEMHPAIVSLQSFVGLAPQKRDSDDPTFWDVAHGDACEELERIRQRLSSLEMLARDDEVGAGRTTEIAPLASQVVDVLGPIAERRDAAFELEVEADLPLVAGARADLRQVLLGIGLRATHRAEPHGTLTLRIGRHSEDGRRGVLVRLEGPQSAIDGDHQTGRDVCREIVEEVGGAYEDDPTGTRARVRIFLREGSPLD